MCGCPRDAGSRGDQGFSFFGFFRLLSSFCGGTSRGKRYKRSNNPASSASLMPNGDAKLINNPAPSATVSPHQQSCTISNDHDPPRWSSCHKLSGTQVRRFDISAAPKSGGAECPTVNGAQETRNCAVNCTGSWQDWGRNWKQAIVSKCSSYAGRFSGFRLDMIKFRGTTSS